jgi:membrane associated rhomboid family serine protease
MDLIDKARFKYAQLDISGKLIVIISISTIAMWLLGMLYPPIENWFAVPSDFIAALLQPWSWLTYGFLHGGIFHLAINMLILYFIGQMMLNLFTGRQFMTLFFTGIIAGGLAFTAASAIFTNYFINSYLVGASAGVFALLFFVCSYMPDTQVRLFFTLNVKLKYVAFALIFFDIVAIATRTNAGGSVAHLAGAALGYYTAIKMKSGIDILDGFAGIGDSVANFFKPSKSKKKSRPSRMKTVYKSNTKKKTAKKPTDQQASIDAILDKISESGYESLTKAEKDFLFKAGKE